MEQMLPLFSSGIVVRYCQYTPASYTRNIWSTVPGVGRAPLGLGPRQLHLLGVGGWLEVQTEFSRPPCSSTEGSDIKPRAKNFGCLTQEEEQQVVLNNNGSSSTHLLSRRKSALPLHVLASLMSSWASCWPGWTNLQLRSSFFLKTGSYLASVVDIATLDPWQTSGVCPEMVFTSAFVFWM